MKKVVILLFLFTQNAITQETLPIKGKIVSSITKTTPIGSIYIQIKGGYNYYQADETGEFSILPKKKQESYILIVEAGSHETLEYKYDSKWSKRKHLKSIVVYPNINASKEIALQDFKKEQLQLYIQGGIAPVTNTKEDDRFEVKYNITYYELGCQMKTEEAILDYNKKAFFLLDMTYGKRWRKKVRDDVIGLN